MSWPTPSEHISDQAAREFSENELSRGTLGQLVEVALVYRGMPKECAAALVCEVQMSMRPPLFHRIRNTLEELRMRGATLVSFGHHHFRLRRSTLVAAFALGFLLLNGGNPLDADWLDYTEEVLVGALAIIGGLLADGRRAEERK